MNQKSHIVLLVAFLVILFTVTVAQAADQKDVATAVKIMRSDSKKNIMERKWYPDGGVRIVFVAKKLRYTRRSAVTKYGD